MASLDSLLDGALARRAGLLGGHTTDALRLFNGEADGLAGLVIEKFADLLVVQIHEGRIPARPAEVRRAVERLNDRLGTRAVYRKWFVRDRARLSAEQAAEHICPSPWIGTQTEPVVQVLENGLKFAVRPYDGFSVGLFLENRDNRRRIRELATGRRVLNTFAYSCAFSVAAAAGGAAGTASVDLHKRYLEWGRSNFALNGLVRGEDLFFLSDSLDFYARAARQGRRYDLVVIDPPTFSRSRRPARVFVLQEHLEALVVGAVRLLDSGGLLLLSTNDRGISVQRMESALMKAGPGRSCRVVARPPLPPDFAGDPDYAQTILAEYG